MHWLIIDEFLVNAVLHSEVDTEVLRVALRDAEETNLRVVECEEFLFSFWVVVKEPDEFLVEGVLGKEWEALRDVKCEPFSAIEDVHDLIDVSGLRFETAGEEIIEGLREDQLLGEKILLYEFIGVNDL